MKQNTLKTLAFTIAMVCAGSLYGQTTRYFQKITSINELTEGIYLVVGKRTYNNALQYHIPTTYNEEKSMYETTNIADNVSSNQKVITIKNDEHSPLYIAIKKEKTKDGIDYYSLKDLKNTKYIGTTNDTEKTLILDKNVKNDLYTVSIIFTEELASLKFNSNYTKYICFNTNNPRFTAYSSIANTVHPYLYKEVPYAYSREIASTNIGTICLPYEFDVSQNTVAKFYEIAGKTTENNSTVLVFNQVNTLEAGLPYIFKPESGTTSLSFTYTGIANPVTTAGNNNGLYGTFEDIEDIQTTKGANVYLISNNIIQKCGTNNGLKANRAYIVMSEVPTYDPSQPHAKAILRVPIDDSSTGIEEVVGSEAQPTEYHSVNGTKLSVPQKGLNIVKMNDGSTQKVFVP